MGYKYGYAFTRDTHLDTYTEEQGKGFNQDVNDFGLDTVTQDTYHKNLIGQNIWGANL